MKCMEYNSEPTCNSKDTIILPPKDDVWFEAIKWDNACVSCKEKNGGNCLDRNCAEGNYDPWGDPFPASLWHPGGNDVDKYLRKKAALLCEKNKLKELKVLKKKLFATKDDWNLKPFSDRHVNFMLKHYLTDEQVQLLKFGYKPSGMDEKWFLYYEGGRLYFYRSWTGLCMYVVTLNANSDQQYVTAYAYNQYSLDDIEEFASEVLNSLLPHFARSNLSKLRYFQEKKQQFIK